MRAGLLVRLAVTRSALKIVDAERARLRRVVLWFGAIDALVSIAALRAQRPAARLPEIVHGDCRIAARDLVHPALAAAVGNDLDLDAGLLITGSNMSGKSTFLRTHRPRSERAASGAHSREATAPLGRRAVCWCQATRRGLIHAVA